MRFAFVVHPISARDVARKYPIARWMPDTWVEAFIKRKKPMPLGHITGIRSLTGAETEGWFIACPLTPKQMVELPLDFVYHRIGQCAVLAKEMGADLIGLGAFTSVVGDGGVTIAKNSPIAVTTGNSYTVATAIEATLLACSQVGVPTAETTLAVVGATGAIGKTCASLLAPNFAKTVLIGRDMERTQALVPDVVRSDASTDLSRLREADTVVTVTSSDAAVILPEHLRPGAVVCDVARPRDVSVRVGKERPDVLVIEGGVIQVPGEADLGFNFGFPPRMAYACMSETMMLALEGRAENFTIGKEVSVAQVEETQSMAARHGFKLARFRSFEKAVDDEAIARARAARSGSPSSAGLLTAKE